jgi:alkyl sulfatase BDS1-like metallo-beta-lactamase superfamily hydrolase
MKLMPVLVPFFLAALAGSAAGQTPATAQKDATEATRAVNRAALSELPMSDRQSFDDARRGLVEAWGNQVVAGAGDRPVWSLQGYEFLDKDEAPDTVNPGLWRHARVNMIGGLFKVTERLYQVRGVDLTNMTIIEGDSGLIVIDPLVTTETAKAAMELYFRHRPKKPVLALIYSHSHADHYGGVRGVISAEDVAAGNVKVIAPGGFLEEAVGENAIAGTAMARHTQYQFGTQVPRGAKGQVDAGLGKALSFGTASLIAPTQLIDKLVETHRIDGVDIVFELTPGAEAPAEMIMYYPQFRVLNMTEIATQNMHNLLPIRGGLVRDALSWSKYIGGALRRYGAKSDIVIAQHTWPVWGNERVQNYLKKQRDTYKFLHDQTVHLMNQGYVGAEIADAIKLPPNLAQEWSTHPFYGQLKNNVRAVYLRYLGYFDGNPATLEALPPVPAAKKAIEYMGGAEAALRRAHADYSRGEYRWVAQVGSQLVFADPTNQDARALTADAYEQLGYQMESATERNAFLQGAWELRNGVPKLPPRAPGSPDVIRSMTLDTYFDALGVRLNGDRAAGKRIVLNWMFSDTGQSYVMNLENSALTHVAGAQDPTADATLTLTRATLDDISLQKTTFQDAQQSGQVHVDGKREKLSELLAMLDAFTLGFPTVEPRPER